MKNDQRLAPDSVNQNRAPIRLAAIDIGTNSIRCINVEVDPQGAFRVLDDEKATVRLGQGLHDSGFISPEAIRRAVEALQRMAKISAGLGAEVAAVVATSAVRKALNRNQFIRDIKEQTGLEIEVISGTTEAELASLSVNHNFAMKRQRYALADIGGGSVEIVVATARHTETVLSLELGAVFLTEAFVHSDPVSDADYKRLRKQIRRQLKQTSIGDGLPVTCLIGSGGTMTNIGSMVMALRGEQFESVHRYEVLRSEIIHLLAMLRRKSHKERLQIAGLNPERADIILAGIVLTNELMRRTRTNLLRINGQGIREGLILRSLRERGLINAAEEPRDWRAAVLEFARSCRFDEPHSLQVERLTRKLFAVLAADNGLTQRHGQLLEAAALLHDIGYFINYDRHHQHSYHLIRHANLFSFTPQEREIVAQVARYHRKGKPKKSHEAFAQLSREDRDLVSKLGGILRLADGLDRRRNGQVDDIVCRLRPGVLELRLQGAGDLSVELYGARSKGDLLEKAFGYSLAVTTEESS